MSREGGRIEGTEATGAPAEPLARGEGAGPAEVASVGRTDAVSAGLVSGEDRFAAGARGGRTSPALGGRRAAPEGRVFVNKEIDISLCRFSTLRWQAPTHLPS